MNVKNEISEELRSLSALVASISRQTPYEVPEGYFANFPTLTVRRIDTETPQIEGRIAALESAKPLTFNVPEGYFQGFAQGVLDRIKAGTSYVPAGGVPAGAAIPAGASIHLGEEDVLPAILAQAGRKTPYQLPEGYFQELSPILVVAREKNPYSVSAGYFDGLADEISAGLSAVRTVANATPAARPARVFSLASRKVWKYAAAAVVTGLLFSVGWLRLHTSSIEPSVKGNGAPADVIAKTMSRVTDQELQSFLADQDTTLAQPVSNSIATTLDMNDNDVKTLLGDVPDGELKQYMEDHGGTNDIATN